LKPLPLSGVQWHVDVDAHRELKRTRSDAITPVDYHDGDFSTRLRSRSGDSVTLATALSVSREHLHHVHRIPGDDDAIKTNGEATANGELTSPSDDDVDGDESGLQTMGNGIGEKTDSDDHVVQFRLPNSGHDDEDVFDMSTHYQGIGRSKFYMPLKSSQNRRKSDLRRRSRSLEDLTLSAAERGNHAAAKSRGPIGSDDFCILTYSEPEELNTGGEFVMFENEGECDFSGGEYDDDGAGGSTSMEVKDLTPIESSSRKGEELMREVGRKRSASATPPKATQPLLAVFQHRLESIIVNVVTYPPGLSFVR